MPTEIVPANCCCGSIGASGLRQCPVDFKLWNGDVRLVSVGRVIRAIFPAPDIDPAVMENARDRGATVDRLFAEYVRGTLQRIPAGTRADAVKLFFKLQRWYDKQNFKSVEVQVLLGGAKYGGVCDFRFDGTLVDLKCVWNLGATHRIQVGGYAWIDAFSKEQPTEGALLHATERNTEARLVPLDRRDIISKWETLMRAYELLDSEGVLRETER